MTPESTIQLNGPIVAHILILTFLSSGDMCMWLFKKRLCLNHFLCLFNWHHRYVIRIDTGSSSSLLLRVDEEHPPSWSSLKLLLLCLFCSSLFYGSTRGEEPQRDCSWGATVTELPFNLWGCKFGSVTIDKPLLSSGVAGGEKASIVVFFVLLLVE